MFELDIFNIDGLNGQNEPAITKHGYDDLDDSPNDHRWRAWWCDLGAGFELRAYPVVKKTPEGAWIDDLAWRQYSKNGREWNLSGLKGKFVFDNRQQSWAKATQEQAIESLAIRLCRWSQRLERDVGKAQSRANVLLQLRPDLSVFANTAKKHLPPEIGEQT